MRAHNSIPVFECEFACLCKHVIIWGGPAALVNSQTGARTHCIHCGRLWAIIPTGAQLLENEHSKPEDRPYSSHSRWHVDSDGVDVEIPDRESHGREDKD
jgi:hypothetical protein